MQPGAGRAVIDGPRRHRCRVAGLNLKPGGRDEPDMCRAAFGHPLAQPEEHAPAGAKTLQVGMSWRTVFAVEVMPVRDSKRRQRLAVKRN